MAQLHRQLVLLRETFRIDLVTGGSLPVGDNWVAMVRAVEGLTVLSRADGGERWIGFYGEDAHDLDVTGMLAAVVGPLASAEVSVFVASTFNSDLVLVPEEQRHVAVTALQAAGHQVREED